MTTSFSTTFDGKPVLSGDELARVVPKNPAGKEVVLTVVRGGQTLAVKAKLRELPLRWARGHRHPRAAEGV